MKLYKFKVSYTGDGSANWVIIRAESKEDAEEIMRQRQGALLEAGEVTPYWWSEPTEVGEERGVRREE